jgi:regulator of CtrA degradation
MLSQRYGTGFPAWASDEGKGVGMGQLHTITGDNSESKIAPFVTSKVFNNLFATGMELVEETALYLDEDGKHAARTLPRDAALSYAGLSMRLTTRLMQIASWLLVLRAVRDGEMSEIEASDEKYRLGRPEGGALARSLGSGLPERMVALVEDTDTLFGRIARLDREIFTPADVRDVEGDAKGQLAALHNAFGK